MTTQTKVSICLPTCNRPDLIVECIESCLAQTHANVEILIGDDSKDDRTQQLIATRYQHEPRVRYVRNTPSLGQARNVSSLFARAVGSKILLIHDDDYLVADGVERLVSLWDRHPDLEVAFANQYEVDQAGHVDREASDRLNADFYRTKSAEGLQQPPGRTGLIQMFPNNGWMANADLVRRISYKEQYGMCCDYVFGVELCLAAKRVYYLNEYVSFYRKTDVSISTTTKRSTSAASVSAYAFIDNLRLDRQLEPARKLALRRIVPIVVSVYSRNHDPVKGLRIAAKNLFAYNYGFSMRLYYHLMMISRSMLTLKPR
ncbi:glycosyltransferase family 2 protein [Paraburkholderia sp. GAS42]|jgi:glycosyltransferase involved in cell wall biosynthesis|uniref:glycosyltransferase family 2 protein n=1 Tax=Paraburkholderia sp. GAS42 TaxID=3035135 RepID=UPI003D1D0D75